jgi:hypothetical protein
MNRKYNKHAETRLALNPRLFRENNQKNIPVKELV